MGSALREVVLWPKIVVNIKDESLERLAGASAGVTSTRRNHCYRDIASLCQIHPLFQPHSVLEIFKKKKKKYILNSHVIVPRNVLHP